MHLKHSHIVEPWDDCPQALLRLNGRMDVSENETFWDVTDSRTCASVTKVEGRAL